MVKIATWNVNSIRVRLQQILHWLQQHQPDVFALQETKTVNEQFPQREIEAAGYHVVYSGQKTYNGVAILSRKELRDVVTDLPTMPDPQRRVLGGTFAHYRILNLYVPNGSEVGSDKFAYKLKWLQSLRDYVKQQLQQYSKLIVLGDFNIAPEDRDVYDPKKWEGHVLVSEPERAALRQLLDLGLVDAFRLFNQESGNYSWWDYRIRYSFQYNLGLRLDLILISQALAKRCRQCVIDQSMRSLERPSDHAPVVVEFGK